MWPVEVPTRMLTIRRLTAGTGYKYLIESIARGDGAADQSSPLTRYYAESGTPPGRFVGGGLAALGLDHGQEVTDEHLYRMLMEVTSPATGDQLGRQCPPAVPPSLEERVEARLARLPAHEREAARAEVRASERQRTQRAPVAAFDLTFSPSKSVSAAWALADEGTKAVIYHCHMRAIDYTLRLRGTELPSLPFGQERRRPGGHRGGGRRRVHPLRHPLR